MRSTPPFVFGSLAQGADCKAIGDVKRLYVVIYKLTGVEWGGLGLKMKNSEPKDCENSGRICDWDCRNSIDDMSRFGNSFTRLHGFIASGLLVAFMGFVLFICLMNWGAIGQNFFLVARATLATVTGPFDGVIARPGDGAAWMAVRFCLPVCAFFLALAAFCQVIPLSFRRGAFALRIGAWTIGLFVWFAGAIPSLINAID